MTAPEQRQTSWNSHLRHNSKALPTDSSGKQGSKHQFHRQAPNTGSCLHTPHFPQIILITTRWSSQASPPPRPQHPSKGGHSYFKINYGGTSGSHQSVPPNLNSCHLPTTVRRQKRQKPTLLEENSSSSNRPPRSGFKWLSDPFKQI